MLSHSSTAWLSRIPASAINTNSTQVVRLTFISKKLSKQEALDKHLLGRLDVTSGRQVYSPAPMREACHPIESRPDKCAADRPTWLPGSPTPPEFSCNPVEQSVKRGCSLPFRRALSRTRGM